MKIMEKNEIIRILENWNFWRKDLATGHERPLYLNRLKRFLATSHIIVITGARRSGKSFIMRQLAKSLIKEGVERNRILFVNLEDPRFHILDAKTLQKIYEVYLEFLNPKQRPYIFLDEVQEVEEGERCGSLILFFRNHLKNLLREFVLDGFRLNMVLYYALWV